MKVRGYGTLAALALAGYLSACSVVPKDEHDKELDAVRSDYDSKVEAIKTQYKKDLDAFIDSTTAFLSSRTLVGKDVADAMHGLEGRFEKKSKEIDVLIEKNNDISSSIKTDFR